MFKKVGEIRIHFLFLTSKILVSPEITLGGNSLQNLVSSKNKNKDKMKMYTASPFEFHMTGFCLLEICTAFRISKKYFFQVHNSPR